MSFVTRKLLWSGVALLVFEPRLPLLCSYLSTYQNLNGSYNTPNSRMPVDLKVIGKNHVKKVPGMEEVMLESLWADQDVVITFFRRFG